MAALWEVSRSDCAQRVTLQKTSNSVPVCMCRHTQVWTVTTVEAVRLIKYMLFRSRKSFNCWTYVLEEMHAVLYFPQR